MKLKSKLLIKVKNIFVTLILIAIVLTIPLQLIDSLILGKNRILKYLEDKGFRALFSINDLRNNSKPKSQ